MSALVSPSNRKRGDTRCLALSFAASLLLHAAAWLAFILMPRPPAVHVFLLAETGEEAVEMEIGSLRDSRPSMASAPSPPPERRFAEERPEPPVDPRETPELREEPTPLEKTETAAQEKTDFEQKEERVRPTRETRREVDIPEIRELAPPELAVTEEGFERPGELEEIRFEEYMSRQSVDAEAPPPPDTAAALAATPLEVPEPVEEKPQETPEAARPLARRRTPTRREQREAPETERAPQAEQEPVVDSIPEALAASQESQASETSRVGAARSVRGVRQKARPQGAFQLIYPHEARLRGESGSVLVAALIGADGRCQSARVERSSGYAVLDNAALDTVRRAPFRPAMLDGIPAGTEERFEIIFELH